MIASTTRARFRKTTYR